MSNVPGFENDIVALVAIIEAHFKIAVVHLITGLDANQGLQNVTKSIGGLNDLDKIIEGEVNFIEISLSEDYRKHLLKEYYSESGLRCFIKCMIMNHIETSI